MPNIRPLFVIPGYDQESTTKHKFSTKLGLILIIITSIIFTLIAFPAFSKEKPISLNDLINEAIENNPEVQEMKNKVKISSLEIPQKVSLEDPMFSVNFMNVPLNKPAFGESVMTGGSVSLSQKFVYPEKLNLQGKIAELQVELEKKELEEKINQIRKEVKLSYYELFQINKSVELLEGNRLLIKDLKKVAEAKYITGSGLQQDIIKSDVEISKINKKMLEFNRQKNEIKFMLNHSLYRHHAMDFSIIPQIKFSSLKLDPQELEKTGINNRPKVIKSFIETQISNFEYQMSKLEYIPDFDIMIGYGFAPDRADLVSGGISVNLPAWYKSKQDNKVRETELMRKMKQDSYDVVKNEVFLNIYNLVEKHRNEEAIYKLISEGLLVQSDQYFKSALAAYQSGKVDFMTVLDSQMTILDYKLDLYMSLVEHEKTIAELEFETGKGLIND